MEKSSILTILSALYIELCVCRRDYEELDDILDTRFHLEDCPYRKELEEIGIEFNEE